MKTPIMSVAGMQNQEGTPPPPEGGYHPASYWQSRFSQTLDLSTVGYRGLGVAFNSWIYRARFRAVSRALPAMGIQTQNASVCDVGVGSGVWIPFWEEKGANEIVGVDLTSESVATLERRHPRHAFLQLDITASPVPASLQKRFDIVTAFDVLFHIVDDNRFEQAVVNLGALAAEGAWVLITDRFRPETVQPSVHERYRSAASYADALQGADLSPVAKRWILGRLIPRGRTLRMATSLAARPKLEFINHALGAVLYLTDIIAGTPTQNRDTDHFLLASKKTGGLASKKTGGT